LLPNFKVSSFNGNFTVFKIAAPKNVLFGVLTIVDMLEFKLRHYVNKLKQQQMQTFCIISLLKCD